MVYQTRSTEIYLPKHYSVKDGNYTLTITNGVTSIKFENIENISSSNEEYKFDLDNELVLPVGEYTYILISLTNNIKECGIMVYGDYKKEDVKTIKNSNNKNIQFNGKRG